MQRQDDLERRVDAATGDMESNAREMRNRAEELDEQIDETRSEWRRKQDDPQVPGAQADDESDEDADAEEEVAGDWEGEGPAAEEAGQ